MTIRRITLLVLLMLALLPAGGEEAVPDKRSEALIRWFEEGPALGCDECYAPEWPEIRRYLLSLDVKDLETLVPIARKYPESVPAQLVILKGCGKEEALRFILTRPDQWVGMFTIPLIAGLENPPKDLAAQASKLPRFVFDYFVSCGAVLPPLLVESLRYVNHEDYPDIHMLMLSHYFGCGVTREMVDKKLAGDRFSQTSVLMYGLYLVSGKGMDYHTEIVKLDDKSLKVIADQVIDKMEPISKKQAEGYVKCGIPDSRAELDKLIENTKDSDASITWEKIPLPRGTLYDPDKVKDAVILMKKQLHEGVKRFEQVQFGELITDMFLFGVPGKHIDIYSPYAIMNIRRLCRSDVFYGQIFSYWSFFTMLYEVAYLGGHTKTKSIFDLQLESMLTP